jgi:predicted TIM-barrel fold metal-dependent hydrolase
MTQMRDLLIRHPKTSIIWAHIGLGRVVHPAQRSVGTQAVERSPYTMQLVEAALSNPALSHVCFDMSWDEVAKYIVASPEVTARAAAIINKYPDRFLFGTDTVAPASPEAYFAVYEMYAPLWKLLTPEASRKVRLGNYERLFDEGRRRVRAWEAANR